MKTANLTGLQEVLLAAASLSGEARSEFTEWDLTVAVWKRDPNKFGCRGYEEQYPDHKRVMMEIMAKKKTENPLRRGWLERTRPNHYRMTDLGSAEAQRLLRISGGGVLSVRSGADVHDAVKPYADHRVFKDHCRDRDQPKTWLAVEAFLGIARNDATHVGDRLRRAQNAVAKAIEWLDENDQDVLRRTGGSGLSFRRSELEKLSTFVTSLEQRFKVQFDALLGRKAGSDTKA